MIAGPESPMASPRMTKIPEPMMAPMPSAVRSRVPIARRSPDPDVDSSVRRSNDLVANRSERVETAIG
jgi:hypothetical protein